MTDTQKEEHGIFSLPVTISNDSPNPITNKFAIKPHNKKLKMFWPNYFIPTEVPELHGNSNIETDLTSFTRLKWVRKTIEDSPEYKTKRINKFIFNPNYLQQPQENQNQPNKKAWDQFCRSINCTSNNITRESKPEITPTQFLAKQQNKLLHGRTKL